MHETLKLEVINIKGEVSYQLLEEDIVCDEDGSPLAATLVPVVTLSARGGEVLTKMRGMLWGGFQYNGRYNPDGITDWGASLGIEQVKDWE